MRVTCDSTCHMGYIYLKPTDSFRFEKSMDIISKYVHQDKLHIPIMQDDKVSEDLKHLKVMNKIYQQAIEDGDFEEEYHNDADDEGYFVGIERTISKEKFINLIVQQAYCIYKVMYGNRNFVFLTLDDPLKVLSGTNVIYPLSNREDVFAVVDIRIQKGFYEDEEFSYKTGFVLGILSSRNDIYPIEYLSDPEFILYE